MSVGTEKKFGYEWDLYREIIPLHEKQFVEWISPVPLSFFKGKRFLDAGCGIGRNSLWALKAGAASGYAFDYDERTVSVARENLKKFSSCQVKFESIYDISFNDEFDVAFCIGVIQHLAHPRKAVEKLVKAIKPGGTLIIWVYAHEGNERYLKFADPIRAHFTSRVHPLITRYISKALTFLLKIYLLFPHGNAYLNLLKERSFRHAEAMVFDQLLPSIAHYFKREEVEALVKGLPVKALHLTHTNGMSWTLVVQKESGGDLAE
ncbi:MAG: class I SAM-dependent methyltransferase [Pseudomonadota bacterium]